MIPNFDLTIRGTGQVIERLRRQQTPPLTQEQLAEKVGCHKGDISRYESNSIGIPFSRLIKLAAAFGLTPEGLLEKCLDFARENGVPLDTYKRLKTTGERPELPLSLED